MAEILYGSELAKELRQKMKAEIDELKRQNKRIPTLAVILVGSNPASLSYVKGKEKACQEIGIGSRMIHLAETISQAELMRTIETLNNDPDVDGILCQLPLPAGLDSEQVIRAIDPEKDVDGFHPLNVAKLYMNEDGFVPCTPLGCMAMLERMGVNPEGKHAVVIGRSNLVGAPVARLLLNKNATVTICHSKTKGLQEIASQADILIAAVGRAKMITSDYIKEGAAVIDVGINRTNEGKLVGDVDFDSAIMRASWITPVPKGVGPMTITMLLKNTLKAYRHREEQS